MPYTMQVTSLTNLLPNAFTPKRMNFDFHKQSKKPLQPLPVVANGLEPTIVVP